MIRPVLHSALRQLHGRITSPVTLAVLAAVSLILGISGPFGTMETLNIGLRLAYWSVVVPVTFIAGSLGPALVEPSLGNRPVWIHLPAASFVSAILVLVALTVLNGSLGFQISEPAFIVNDFGMCFVICLAIESVKTVMVRHWGQLMPSADTSEVAQRPRLLARLPANFRGELVSLSVRDHYVRVATTLGSHDVLIRLCDAILETQPTVGLQVHRSHWIASAQVVSGRRSAETAILVMSNGAEIPVSRAKVKEVQTAGLLSAAQIVHVECPGEHAVSGGA